MIEHVTWVALDAQTITDENFMFGAGRLSRLRHHVQAGRVKVVVTESAFRAVEKELVAQVRRAALAGRNFREAGAILRNCRDPRLLPVLPVFDPNDVIDELREQWHSYCDECVERLLPVAEGGGAAGEASPLAWQSDLQTLSSFAQQEGVKVTVLRHGPGGSETAALLEGVEILVGLEAFLSSIEEAHRQFWKFAQRLLLNHLGHLETAIVRLCGSAKLFVTNWEGEIEEVVIEGVDDHEAIVTSVDEDEVGFEVSCTVTFRVAVSYPDPNAAIWDPEKRDYWFARTLRTEVREAFAVAATGLGTCTKGGERALSIEALELQRKSFGITLQLGDRGFPW